MAARNHPGLDGWRTARPSYGYDRANRLTGVSYSDRPAHLYDLGGDGSRLGVREVAEYPFAGALGPEAYGAELGGVEKRYRYGGLGGLTQIDDGGG